MLRRRQIEPTLRSQKVCFQIFSTKSLHCGPDAVADDRRESTRRELFGPFVVTGTTLGMMAFQSGPADVIGHFQ